MSSGETIAHRVKLKDGSASDLSFQFASDPGTGFYLSNGGIQFVVGGTSSLFIDDSGGAISGAFAPGSVSAPSIYAVGDTNTGIYFPAADQVAITAGGTQRALFSATAATFSAVVLAADGTAAAPAYSFSSTGGADNGMYLAAADQVAIATGGAQRALFTSTAATFSAVVLAADGTAAAPAFSFASTGSADNGMYLAAANSIGFATAGVARVVIGSGGSFYVTSADVDFTTASAQFVRVASTGATNQNAQLRIQTAVGGGDPFITLVPEGGTGDNWSIGADNSDSDSLVFDDASAPGANTRLKLTHGGAMTLFSSYFEVKNQADPGAVTDGVRFGSVDLSAGNATLSLRTETAVAADVAVASTHSLSVQLNGATYKILLSNV